MMVNVTNNYLERNDYIQEEARPHVARTPTIGEGFWMPYPIDFNTTRGIGMYYNDMLGNGILYIFCLFLY